MIPLDSENSTRYLSHMLNIQAAKSLPIIVGSGVLGQLDQLFGFKSYSSIVLISDKTVKELYGKGVKPSQPDR